MKLFSSFEFYREAGAISCIYMIVPTNLMNVDNIRCIICEFSLNKPGLDFSVPIS